MKAITNYRYWVLTIVCIVALLGTFSAPQDDAPLLTWIYVLVTSKIIGFASFLLDIALAEKWMKAGKLPELKKFFEEDDEE